MLTQLAGALKMETHIPSLVEDDEVALVRAARAAPSAFGPLYHRYVDRVYAYLRARTSGEADAADLTQQVFLRAMDAWPRYRGADGAFAAWLLRIARNAAVDFHRRRRETVAWDHVPETLHPRSEQCLDGPLERAEALARLGRLYRALDPDTRELLVLRFTAGLRVAEIAAVLGKSEAAVQKQLSRTIQRLKEHYDDDDKDAR
jgi:RNA polymerase sigma-70 factor (ECF subfamily)